MVHATRVTPPDDDAPAVEDEAHVIPPGKRIRLDLGIAVGHKQTARPESPWMVSVVFALQAAKALLPRIFHTFLLTQASCPRMVKFSGSNAAAVHVRHPAKPHAKGRKPQPRVIAAVVQAVMVVAVEHFAHSHAARQFINGVKPMRMGTRRFVLHQNIGALRD